MRYKVGDKVRVRKDLEMWERYGAQILFSDMLDLRGKIVTIERLFPNAYLIKEDIKGYRWTDEMLEPIKIVTNWDKVKEEAKQIIDSLETAETNIICKAIHETKKENSCIWRSCDDCKEWLKEPYQEPSILDDIEKEYLKAVIKPWRDKVAYITLCANSVNKQYIAIGIKGDDETGILLPNFEANTMYKGMKQGKEYTLEDLDL